MSRFFKGVLALVTALALPTTVCAQAGVPLSQFGRTTSDQLRSIIKLSNGTADSTGTGPLVFSNHPFLATPDLGVATATSVNKLVITPPTTIATLTIGDGLTLNAGPGGTLGTAAFTAASSYIAAANNLSELTSAATARVNLGLGTAAQQPISAFLSSSNNLSDLGSASTARTNLGLGTAAVLNTGVSAGNVVVLNGSAQLPAVSGALLTGFGTAAYINTGTSAGNVVVLNGSAKLPAVDGSLLTNLPAAGGGLVAANNLSDLASASTARTNLGLAPAATTTIGTSAGNLIVLNGSAKLPAVDGSLLTNLPAAGGGLVATNNLSDLVSASTARTNLGLGTSATHASTDYLLVANNLSDVTAATARTNLGLGTAAVVATGTSGGTIPLLNGTNTWSATQAFAATTVTSVNKVAITAPASSATITVLNGKTLTVDKTLEFDGTDSTKMTFPAVSSTVLTTGNTATLTKGILPTAYSLGTMSSFTIDITNGNYQYGTNGGAFTLTAPAADGGVSLLVTNNGSAGSITFSGFTVGSNTGDVLTTTNTSKFLIAMQRINGVATYIIKALQ